MIWRDEYQSKLVSLEEATKKIKSGDVVWFGALTSAPIDFLETLSDRYLELKDVTLVSCYAMHPFKFLKASDCIGHLNYHSLFYGAFDRKLFANGNVNISSVHLSNLDIAIQNYNPNVFVADVSLPDDEGYMYYGPMGVFGNDAAKKCSDFRIVQVNKDQPKVKGILNKIHISEVDYVCEADHPLPVLNQPEPSEVDKKIAKSILPYIEDGSTIQVGLGGLANAVAYGLEKKKNLAVHTEMFTDSMMYLAKKGVINGKMYVAFALGSRELNYYCSHENVQFAPIYVVNKPTEIMKNDNMVSINACLILDLTGQVASEGVGFRQISSTGGQVDYVRGAAMSKGGKSFLCLSSSNKDKKTGEASSNIRLALPAGTPITTARSDVMYVVTEYGIADLYCKSIEQRVNAMISIAHPDFREQLRIEAMKVGYIKE